MKCHESELYFHQAIDGEGICSESRLGKLLSTKLTGVQPDETYYAIFAKEGTAKFDELYKGISKRQRATCKALMYVKAGSSLCMSQAFSLTCDRWVAALLGFRMCAEQ